MEAWEVHVVEKLAVRRVHQGQFHVVSLVNDYDRAGHGAVEGERPDELARRDLYLGLLDFHPHFHDPGFAAPHLLVLRQEGRRDQLPVSPAPSRR